MTDQSPDQYRHPSSKVWFEYHCEESHESADARLWYHSHQLVTVLACENDADFGHMTQVERFEGCVPLVYKIQFADGFESAAFEDELLDSENEYQRPPPPRGN